MNTSRPTLLQRFKDLSSSSCSIWTSFTSFESSGHADFDYRSFGHVHTIDITISPSLAKGLCFRSSTLAQYPEHKLHSSNFNQIASGFTSGLYS